ncbi:hypothetical protein BGZ83_010312 [Gryganskiella cystojenkinii]|nr:hypothetical protein BGZ83_010312 [Gryganskiella cystojenkinii]
MTVMESGNPIKADPKATTSASSPGGPSASDTIPSHAPPTVHNKLLTNETSGPHSAASSPNTTSTTTITSTVDPVPVLSNGVGENGPSTSALGPNDSSLEESPIKTQAKVHPLEQVSESNTAATPSESLSTKKMAAVVIENKIEMEEDPAKVIKEARALLENDETDEDLYANRYPSVLFRPQLDDIMLDEDLLQLYEQMKSLVSRSPLKTAQLLYAFSCATDHLALDLEVRRSSLDMNKKAFTFFQENTWFAVDLDLNIDDLSEDGDDGRVKVNNRDDDEAYDSDPRIKILPARHSLFPALQNHTSRYFKEQDEAHRAYYAQHPHQQQPHPFTYPPPPFAYPYPYPYHMQYPGYPALASGAQESSSTVVALGTDEKSEFRRKDRDRERNKKSGKRRRSKDRDMDPAGGSIKRPKSDRPEWDRQGRTVTDGSMDQQQQRDPVTGEYSSSRRERIRDQQQQELQLPNGGINGDNDGDQDANVSSNRRLARLERQERKLAKKRLRQEQRRQDRAQALAEQMDGQASISSPGGTPTVAPAANTSGTGSSGILRPFKITLVHSSKGNTVEADNVNKSPAVWENAGRPNSGNNGGGSSSSGSNLSSRPIPLNGQESPSKGHRSGGSLNNNTAGSSSRRIKIHQFSPPQSAGSHGPQSANSMSPSTSSTHQENVGGASASSASLSASGVSNVDPTNKSEDVLKKGTWTSAEEEILLEAVRDLSSENWHAIAMKVPGRNAKQCMQKWQTDLDPQINRLPWTPAEDEKLVEAYHTFGNSWQQIAKMVETRTWYQCYNRVRAKSVKNKILMTAGTHPASLANQANNNSNGRAASVGSESPSRARTSQGGNNGDRRGRDNSRDRQQEPRSTTTPTPSTPSTPSTPMGHESMRGHHPMKVEDQDSHRSMASPVARPHPSERTTLDRDSMDGPHQAHAAYTGRLNQASTSKPSPPPGKAPLAAGSKPSLQPVTGHLPTHPPRHQPYPPHSHGHHQDGSWSKSQRTHSPVHGSPHESPSDNAYRSPQLHSQQSQQHHQHGQHQRHHPYNSNNNSSPSPSSSSRPQHSPTLQQPAQASGQKPRLGYSGQPGQIKPAGHYGYPGKGGSGSGSTGLGIHSGEREGSTSHSNSPKSQHSMMPPPPSPAQQQSPRQHSSPHSGGSGNDHRHSPVAHHQSQTPAHQRQHSSGGGGPGNLSSHGSSSTSYQSKGTTASSSSSGSPQKPIQQRPGPQEQGGHARRQEPLSPLQKKSYSSPTVNSSAGSGNSGYAGQHGRQPSLNGPSTSSPSTTSQSKFDSPSVLHQSQQNYHAQHHHSGSGGLQPPRTASPSMASPPSSSSSQSQRPLQPVSHPGSVRPSPSSSSSSSYPGSSTPGSGPNKVSLAPNGSPSGGHGSTGGPSIVTTPKSGAPGTSSSSSSPYSAAPLAPAPLLSPSIANSPSGFISTSALLMMARNNANANANSAQGSPSSTAPATPSTNSSSSTMTLSPPLPSAGGQQQQSQQHGSGGGNSNLSYSHSQQQYQSYPRQ